MTSGHQLPSKLADTWNFIKNKTIEMVLGVQFQPVLIRASGKIWKCIESPQLGAQNYRLIASEVMEIKKGQAISVRKSTSHGQ